MSIAHAPVAPSQSREGLEITFGTLDPQIVSDVWVVGGWSIQFVRLGAHQSFALNRTAGTVYVKVVDGELNVPQRTAFAEDRAIRDTRVDHDAISAGDRGALVALLIETSAADETVTSMDQLDFSGPLAEHLQWQSFEAKFGRFLDFFNGKDAHMASGFHLLDEDGSEIAYVLFWTAGKGVDLSTHNHGNDPTPTAPAFAEVHWVFNNGTGRGGMYETPEPDAPDRDRHPMQRGEEHGPFFVVDPSTGKATLRDNGAVEYPWHGWQAGDDGEPGQAYDFVAAFEISPAYARVSSADQG